MAKTPKPKKAVPVEPNIEPVITGLSRRAWWLGCIAVTAVAAFFRCYKLGLKPFHHDEGVNGHFMITLVNKGVYAYNPHDYHGPSLYFFALASSFFLGLNGNAMRLVPVVFGIATVILVFCLRRYIGAVGALSAGLLLAVSPGAIYISRYFIHESLFVFFTLAIVVALLRWWDTTNVAYLIVTAASAALLFATKETAFISIGVLIIAGLCVAAVELVMGAGRPRRKKGASKQVSDWWSGAVARFGGPTGLAVQLFAAVSAFIIVYVVFFSSFFTHRDGVVDSFKAYQFWSKTGTKDHTSNGWYAYIWWLRSSESPLLLLGALGAGLALWYRRNRVALFIGLWAWGITAAYTLIPYKTPWLALNFVIPLALASGMAIDWLARGRDNLEGRIAGAVLLGAATLFCSYQAVQLNFVHYDDDTYPYVYAHTKRDLLKLVAEIDSVAKRSGMGPATGIVITSPEHWPLPWYLRDYSRVGYYGQMSPAGNAEMVLGRSDQREELDATLFSRYRMVGEYPLRPGVTLLLYVRTDLATPETGENPPRP